MTTSNPSRPAPQRYAAWPNVADTTTDTKPCLDAIGELLHSVRIDYAHHELLGHDDLAREFARLADTLDRVRTILVQEGADYLEAAFAFLDAGRLVSARLRMRAAQRAVL